MPPVSVPWDNGFLAVSSLHTIHYMQCGNPKGLPVLYLHGGPGTGCSEKDTDFFDPERYRIILHSQRGTGQSRPLAEIQENTTWDLVSDIEKLRIHLQVDEWILFGGSWGSTLALAYAQTHPAPVKAMILRGIFLMNTEYERQWMSGTGAGMLYPEEWDALMSSLPEELRMKTSDGNVMALFREYLLTVQDPRAREEACIAWNRWELTVSSFDPQPAAFDELNKPGWNLPHAILEAHYFANKGWLEPDQLIKKENIDKIRHIPCIAIHGQYDCCCPRRNAVDLKTAWPEMELQWSRGGSHSARDPPNFKLLVEATDHFATRFFTPQI